MNCRTAGFKSRDLSQVFGGIRDLLGRKDWDSVMTSAYIEFNGDLEPSG